MKILLICSGGVSTSILAANVRKYLGVSDKIKALPLSQITNQTQEYDVILIAPQIKYLCEKLQNEHPAIPIGIMDESMYGKMDGKAVCAYAQRLAGHKKEKGEKKTMKKLKITLCCNGGVSTKLLCKKIISAAESHEFEVECDAYSATMIDAAAPGSDLILMGPQIKFMAKTIQEKFPDIPGGSHRYA